MALFSHAHEYVRTSGAEGGMPCCWRGTRALALPSFAALMSLVPTLLSHTKYPIPYSSKIVDWDEAIPKP